MAQTHNGYFLIADITGYTQYLNESELEHAQETLTALLELLVSRTRPPLVISRLAGDAVISYALGEDFFQGQTFIEKIEDTYVTFRKAIERMVLNNTCRCNACANISNLDLKFFVHYGTFGIQRIRAESGQASGHDELVGSDVNLIHRLLKNRVAESTGVRAYALFTDAAVRQLDNPQWVETLEAHREAYEHLGEVQVWVQDMHPVWECKRETTKVDFPQDRIWARFQVDIDLPRETTWDYLVQPEYRNTLIGSDRMEITNRSKGRVAPGSVYQYYHGDKVVPQTILEWQPFERMIVREMTPIFPDVGGLSEYRLEAIEGGTRLTKTSLPPDGPFMQRTTIRMMLPIFKRMLSGVFETFKQEIEADYRNRRQPGDHGAEIRAEQIRSAAGESLWDEAESGL